MKKSLLTLFIFFSLFSGAQNPLVKMWDRRYGGTGNDILTALIETKDGGLLIGGYSGSGISGDKTQLCWGFADYWIVKLDAFGVKQWDKDFGGILTDELLCLQQTSDGGYLLGGFSNSGISGDKTEPLRGTCDFWIVKTDSIGNKLWDKDFGGTAANYLFSLQQTSDGGYVLGGFSTSGAGGDKTQPSQGGEDYWIVKTDSLGNKLWDKDFGGGGYDGNHSPTLLQTRDGGYILGGYSSSGISGDKTEVCFGSYDYWVIKMDSIGNKQWDRDYGGTAIDFLYSLIQSPDGGFIFGGATNSGISGNKTSPLWAGQVDTDWWIVKTDSLGIIQWQKDFGGTDGDDEFGNIVLTDDGGYLFSGTSYSDISGDKTENNLGNEQTWVVKTDSLGNRQWDKTMFTATTFDDEIGLGIQTQDGCYVFANYTNAGIGGYKTQPSWGPYDIWVIKFCDSLLLPPTATAYTDGFLCPGTCTDFLNLSSNTISFLWSFPGATPNTSTDVNPQNICYANPGSYDVQLIATNANGSDTLLLTNCITVYPAPPPQSITQSGDTLFAIAGATSYQWYFNGNIVNGATDYFYVAQVSGDYNVVATDGNGCEVEAAVFNVLASEQSLVIGQWSLYPNPVDDKVTIHKAQGTKGTARQGVLRTLEISVYNLVGEVVLRERQESRSKTQDVIVDVSEFAPGMYWIEIISGEKNYRAKFIKE